MLLLLSVEAVCGGRSGMVNENKLLERVHKVSDNYTETGYSCAKCFRGVHLRPKASHYIVYTMANIQRYKLCLPR